ncbi:type IV pilin N-terminal domain-containing protein [Haladaptatus sp. YSMS36]|uniref:type IV pilin N-terminal domain-containing protein n=1 Tax=Haladaptatus sp. YSMS36 TaxID=3033384 RepID=UPI0023E7D16F|nr:type IV pilin N-terminal domain-containing protein [Haladaptatus sp. YSMS36]
MHLKQLFTEEDAVSPVIGVILMVAITVILAAVIGTFVLGLGDQVGNSAPQASFSFDYNGADTLVVTHESGDKIAASKLMVKSGSTSESWATIDGSASFVTAGNSITLNAANTNWGTDIGGGDTVRLVYDDGSGDTSTLQKWSGPQA